MAPSQLSRAGTAQAKDEAVLHHESLNFVQELGHLLDFIDEDNGGPGGQSKEVFPQAARVPEKAEVIGVFKKVEAKGRWEPFEQKGSLPSLPGTP